MVSVSITMRVGSSLLFAWVYLVLGARLEQQSCILTVRILTNLNPGRLALSSIFSNPVCLFLNLSRCYCQHISNSFLVYAFNIGFYALPLMADIGFSRGFGLLAALNGVA